MSNLDDHALQASTVVSHESRNMSDELNVWREAVMTQFGCTSDKKPDAAAAVIRDYGDKRYQQAIADVVEWLHSENGLCDCFARSETECACGAWDDYKQWPLERTAQEITRRFGKTNT